MRFAGNQSVAHGSNRVPGGIGRGHQTFRRARAVGEGSWLGQPEASPAHFRSWAEMR